jgi:cobaltochelatase CobN
MSSHNISGTPSINYCAQYLWIKEGFGADAVIHFGTHGSLEFLEGKDVLLSQKDWTDALITDLPNGYIYIVDDPAEALIAKRRSFAVILSHLAPMFAEAGLYAELKILAEDMHSYLVTESAELKQGYLEKVHKALLENKLDKLLSLEEMNKYPLTDAQLRLVHDRFHSLSKELIPMGLHIYGELPSKERITEMLYCLKKEEVEKALRNSLGISGGLDCQIEEQIKPLALELIYKTIDGKDMVAILDKYANAEQLAVILQNVRNVSEKIDYSEKEIESAVRFLEGKYIFPSPGGDMIFNPNVLPTGRNLFGIDPESVPTRAAFMAGEKSAEKIRNKFLKNENKPLEKIAFTLWGVNTVMDQGITESQILWFLGARPIYDQADNCVDVELIPSSELKRARIDVLVQVSGEYRDIFGSRLKLLDKAIKLAAQEKNEIIENFVRKHSLEMEKDFVAEGISLAEAKRLSLGRIFGPKERAYSIAARQMYKNTSLWNSETDIAQVYIDNMSGLYSSDSWGKLEDILFKKVARDLDVIVQSRSMKRIGGPLSLDHTYEFSGGLNIAVRSLSDNKSAKIYFSDNRVLNNPEIVSLKEAIVNEALSAMFNPKFIEALMENKLSGAAELKNLIENLYGWQITSPEDVDDELWLKTFEIYFKDKYDIKLDEFLKANNLFVYQDIAAVMLDAIRKGYWNADQSVKKDLAKVFGDLISIHGPSCSERLCANSALLNYMERYFQSTKDILNKHELALYMDNIKAALGNKGKKAKGSAKVDLGIIQILKKN